MGQSINISIGTKFESWTVIEERLSINGRGHYLCKCKCETERIILTTYLIRGQPKSCGCLKNEINPKFDIVGKKFGKLAAIKFDGMRGGHRYWLCECDCAKHSIISVRGSHLRSGSVKSCGCSQIDDIEGKIFSYLAVIAFLGVRDTNAYWLCECICKNKKEVSANNLKSGGVQSCGCKALELRKETSMENWGVDNPMKSKVLQEVLRNANTVKYGVPCTLQFPKFNKKSKETLMNRYGVDHPMHSPAIALKVAKSSNNSKALIHWSSKEEVICVASYEVAVVEQLNDKQIDYNWQPQTFTMPDGRTFTPDLYLPDRDVWVEIKGWFRDDAEEKWNWFHAEYPNSELWNEKKLKEMGII